MIIKSIFIKDNIREKIFKKHNLLSEDIEALFGNQPLFLKTRLGRYIAIGYIQHFNYITVIFEYRNGVANIVTAYLSSKNQRELYKRKARL